METMYVRLTAAEQRIVRFIAKSRSQTNRQNGITDARVGPQSSEDLDIIGFGAEMAFCKMFNVYPDFSVQPRKGGADCLRFGNAIDVKSTTYGKGKLLAVPNKELLAADVYALMIVEWAYKDDESEALFRFAGFAKASELLAENRLTDLGHGPTYAINQDELAQTHGAFAFVECPLCGTTDCEHMQ